MVNDSEWLLATRLADNTVFICLRASSGRTGSLFMEYMRSDCLWIAVMYVTHTHRFSRLGSVAVLWDIVK